MFNELFLAVLQHMHVISLSGVLVINEFDDFHSLMLFLKRSSYFCMSILSSINDKLHLVLLLLLKLSGNIVDWSSLYKSSSLSAK